MLPYDNLNTHKKILMKQIIFFYNNKTIKSAHGSWKPTRLIGKKSCLFETYGTQELDSYNEEYEFRVRLRLMGRIFSNDTPDQEHVFRLNRDAIRMNCTQLGILKESH